MRSLILAEIALAIFGITHLSLGAVSTSFQRSSELQPMRMSYDDVMKVVERARELAGPPSNQPFTSAFEESESLDITTPTSRFLLPSGFTREDLARAPEVAYGANYTLRRANNPVSEIELSLRDFSRTVRVSGPSGVQVDAASFALTTALDQYTTRFGGYGLRLSLGLFMCIAIGIVPNLITKWLPPDTPPTLHLAVLLIVPATLLCILLLPSWDRWLAGFTVYQGSANFAVRYSAEISLWSLILGLPSLTAIGRYIKRAWLTTAETQIVETPGIRATPTEE